MATHLAESRAVPASPVDTFDQLLAEPLEDICRRRYAAIPAVRGTREAPATWDTVGQSRRIVLSDGGTMVETLTLMDRPHAFGYDLTDFTGPMGPLVASLEGRWSVEPAGTGCRVTWEWTVHPRGSLGALGVPILGRMWHGYARQVLEELERLLVGS